MANTSSFLNSFFSQIGSYSHRIHTAATFVTRVISVHEGRQSGSTGAEFSNRNWQMDRRDEVDDEVDDERRRKPAAMSGGAGITYYRKSILLLDTAVRGGYGGGGCSLIDELGGKRERAQTTESVPKNPSP